MVRKRTSAIDVENLVGKGPRRRTALRGAYRDHSGAVYSVARGLCGSEAAADVTKEVFLRLSSHPERFGPDSGSLRASLLRVTQDVAIDTARLEPRPRRVSAAGRPETELDDRRGPPKSAGERPRGPRPLYTLSANEREAIVAVYYGGCTYREAAVALGLTEGAVKRSLRDGLRNLRHATANLVSASSHAVHGNLRSSTTPDHGLAEALDSRAVVAHAQGVIMEREGKSASAAYTALLELSDARGMTLPACAEAVVESAGHRVLDPASAE